MVLALIMCVSTLAACGKKNQEGADADPRTPDTEQTPAEDLWDATPESAFEFSNGVITKYIGDHKIVRIPKKISGSEVTTIGDSSFLENTVITELYLPDCVKTIEASAFALAENLRVIDLGNVVTIGDDAFLQTPLESIVMSPACETIGNEAFRLKVSSDPIVDMIIPASVKSIGERGLSANRIKTFTFEGTVLPDFGKDCFFGIKAVIYVNDALGINDEVALATMEKFKAAEIQVSTKVLRMDGSPLFADYSADYDYEVLISTARINKYIGDSDTVIVPGILGGQPVTIIGDSAFKGNESIKKVVLPDGLETIYDGAFGQCPSLESVEIPDSVTKIGIGVFAQTNNLKSIVWPSSAEEIGYNSFQESGLESIAIPEGVKTIGDYAFQGCESLKNVTMGSTVRELGWGAFEGCISLEAIDFLPAGLKEIPNSAFKNCERVGVIRVPEGVTHIREDAFSGCGEINSDTGLMAELGVKYSIYAKDPEAELGSSWVNDDRLPRIVSIYLPSTIEYIGPDAFRWMWIAGIHMPTGIHEVSQLPEFDGCFRDIRVVRQIYFDDKTTEDQMDLLDDFFMQFKEVGDVCWYYSGGNYYWIKEG